MKALPSVESNRTKTSTTNLARWNLFTACPSGLEREPLGRVRQSFDRNRRAARPITRRRPTVAALLILLLLVANVQAIDWELRPVGRYTAGGGVSDLVIVGNHGYAVTGDALGPGGLRVFDVSNPANPALLAEYRTGNRARSVAVADGYAYIVGGGTLDVFELSNSVIPRWLGSCNIPQNDAMWVAASGHYIVARENS